MKIVLRVEGEITEDGHLLVDLPPELPRGRVVVTLEPLPLDTLELIENEGVNEDEWLRAASRNPAFRDLEAPEEDVYSVEDGEPFLDQV